MNQDNQHNSNHSDTGFTSGTSGCWIGLDWGTSNCSAAVYDRPRGRSKWMRLASGGGPVLCAATDRGKPGRIMPTVALLATESYLRQHNFPSEEKGEECDAKQNHERIQSTRWIEVTDLDLVETCETAGKQETNPVLTERLYALIGVSALYFSVNSTGTYSNGATEKSTTFAQIAAATIRSAKRSILAQQPIRITPLGTQHSCTLSPVATVALFLRTLRTAADAYLTSRLWIQKQALSSLSNDAAATPPVQHACLGVPAAAPRRFRTLLQAAARQAGLESSVVTAESTAAGMAYGLSLPDNEQGLSSRTNHPSDDENDNNMAQRAVLVFDMGGGTTDVTISVREQYGVDGSGAAKGTSESSGDTGKNTMKIIVTHGNDALGGDDMDVALQDAILRQKDRPVTQSQACTAKLVLCGLTDTLDKATIPPSEDKMLPAVDITVRDWNEAIKPVLSRVRACVQVALDRFSNQDYGRIHEVVLIGGASRVPAVRELLRDMFSVDDVPELCTSLNAESAVAQGCSVVAAIHSGAVPVHELRSAFMLDTVPHTIGVLLHQQQQADFVSENTFVQIIPRGATLPASGFSTFTVANPDQPGVTIQAVEVTNLDEYTTIGDFTFLIHRFNKSTPSLQQRSVDIGMQLATTGEFTVSIFDPNDPEHIAKKHRALGHENRSEEPLSSEQRALVMACISLFVLYVAMKIAFIEDVEYIQD